MYKEPLMSNSLVVYLIIGFSIGVLTCKEGMKYE